MIKSYKDDQFEFWKGAMPPINQTKIIIKEIDKIIDKELNVKKNASKELNKIYQRIKETELKIESKIAHELNKYIKLGYLRENKTVFRSGKTLLPVSLKEIT